MIQYVFKPSRKKCEKTVKARLYSGRYRLEGDHKPTTVSLGVTDKQVAEKKLAEIVKSEQRRRAKFDPSLEELAVANAPLDEILEDWLGDLEAKGRTSNYARPHPEPGGVFCVPRSPGNHQVSIEPGSERSAEGDLLTRLSESRSNAEDYILGSSGGTSSQ